MIIKLNYNKSDGTLTVSSDVPECNIVVNPNATIDDNEELSVELALDTTYLAEIQSTDVIINE